MAHQQHLGGARRGLEADLAVRHGGRRRGRTARGGTGAAASPPRDPCRVAHPGASASPARALGSDPAHAPDLPHPRGGSRCRRSGPAPEPGRCLLRCARLPPGRTGAPCRDPPPGGRRPPVPSGRDSGPACTCWARARIRLYVTDQDGMPSTLAVLQPAQRLRRAGRLRRRSPFGLRHGGRAVGGGRPARGASCAGPTGPTPTWPTTCCARWPPWSARPPTSGPCSSSTTWPPGWPASSSTTRARHADGVAWLTATGTVPGWRRARAVRRPRSAGSCGSSS